MLEDIIESSVVDLVKVYAKLQSEDYLRVNKIVVVDKDGKLNTEKSFQNLEVPLRNTTNLPVSSSLFDSAGVAEQFRKQHPWFAKNYMYNGTWEVIKD